MNVSFRSVEKRDATVLRLTQEDWRKIQYRRKWGSGSYASSLPSRVVTIDSQIVLAFDGAGQVFFQDDRFPIAELVRADKRVWQSMIELSHHSLKELKDERSGRKAKREEVWTWIRNMTEEEER